MRSPIAPTAATMASGSEAVSSTTWHPEEPGSQLWARAAPGAVNTSTHEREALTNTIHVLGMIDVPGV